MREELIASKKMELLRCPTDMRSDFSRVEISCGEYAVAIDTPGQYDSMIWYSLVEVDDIAEMLRQFKPANPDEKFEYELFGPYHALKYEYSTTGAPCLVCEEDELEPVPFINFDRSLSYMPWCHLECAEELADGLERVWEYRSELLADAI